MIDGTTTYTFTAPVEPGEHTVTLTGRQSGVVATATFTVSAAAPSPSLSASAPGVAGDGAGSGAGGGSSSAAGVLGNTGAAIAPFAVLVALLLAAGTVLVLQRRRRAHPSLAEPLTRRAPQSPRPLIDPSLSVAYRTAVQRKATGRCACGGLAWGHGYGEVCGAAARGERGRNHGEERAVGRALP